MYGWYAHIFLFLNSEKFILIHVLAIGYKVVIQTFRQSDRFTSLFHPYFPWTISLQFHKCKSLFALVGSCCARFQPYMYVITSSAKDDFPAFCHSLSFPDPAPRTPSSTISGVPSNPRPANLSVAVADAGRWFLASRAVTKHPGWFIVVGAWH